MIQDDLENVDFLQLTEIEQMEFNLKLLNNYNTLIMQLMAAKNYVIAGIMSESLRIYELNPNNLVRLLEFANLLYTATAREREITQRAQTVSNEASNPSQESERLTTETTETKEAINENEVITIEGKEN